MKTVRRWLQGFSQLTDGRYRLPALHLTGLCPKYPSVVQQVDTEIWQTWVTGKCLNRLSTDVYSCRAKGIGPLDHNYNRRCSPLPSLIKIGRTVQLVITLIAA